MRWLDRVRGKFGGEEAPAPLGQGWSPAVEAAWPELQEAIDGQLRRPGAAAVSTWEVGVAELARRTIGEADEAALLTRYSDALVPTLEALQAPHKALPAALEAGRAGGRSAGTLAAATRPLVLLPRGLDAELEAGWHKTVAYLEPVLAAGRDPAAARAALAAAGPALRQGAVAAEATLRDRLSRLPYAVDAEQGLVAPFEAWAEVLDRAIEVEVYHAVRGMIAALR